MQGTRSDIEIPRCLGHLKGDRPGPLVIFTAGVHGNEPAGLEAVKLLFKEIAASRLKIAGEVWAFSGNRRALAQEDRYLARDLNRNWTNAEVLDLLNRDPSSYSPEDHEQREILTALAPFIVKAQQPIVFIDLHTTSGDGPAFCCLADVIRNRQIGFALPVTAVLGIEEVLRGTMLGFLSNLGHIAIAIEGGQHRAPETVQNHLDLIWIALSAAKSISRREIPELPARQARLAAQAKELPHMLELKYRHVIPDGAQFDMEPGFANFSPVESGQLLAHENGQALHALETGLMMMPRYQGLGEDGFFIANRLTKRRRFLSRYLRKFGLDRLCPYLPGFRRQDDELVCDELIQDSWQHNLLELCGYRLQDQHLEAIHYKRRRPDAQGLAKIPAVIRALAQEIDAAT